MNGQKATGGERIWDKRGSPSSVVGAGLGEPHAGSSTGGSPKNPPWGARIGNQGQQIPRDKPPAPRCGHSSNAGTPPKPRSGHPIPSPSLPTTARSRNILPAPSEHRICPPGRPPSTSRLCPATPPALIRCQSIYSPLAEPDSIPEAPKEPQGNPALGLKLQHQPQSPKSKAGKRYQLQQGWNSSPSLADPAAAPSWQQQQGGIAFPA